jgi:hypothetical protein
VLVAAQAVGEGNRRSGFRSSHGAKSYTGTRPG